MVKCPFCHFENEDGALFCEQCKSDLAASESAAGAVPLTTPESGAVTPVAAVAAQPVPFAPVAEAAAPAGDAVVAEAALAEAVPVVQLQVEGESFPSAPVAVAVAEPLPASAAPMPTTAQTMPGLVSPTAPAPTPVTTPALTEALPAGAQPKLVAVRGQRMQVEYPIFPGPNYVGRADEKPVDIDLEDQESPDRVYCSRQHALITFEDGRLTIEDLNSANGTFVNRTRVYPGQRRPLQEHDIIQLGTVWLKVKL